MTSSVALRQAALIPSGAASYNPLLFSISFSFVFSSTTATAARHATAYTFLIVRRRQTHMIFPISYYIGAGKSHETISYFFTTILPNGAKLAWAMLKQAMPKGIPIIVQHQRTPAIAEPSASQKPARTIQIKFRKALPTPAVGEGTSFFPNGQKANPAIRKLAMPNGMPMIVQHQRSPIKSHASPSQMPPNANQRRLPINTILSPDFQRDTRNSSIGFLHNVFHSPSTQRITSQD